MFCCLLFITQYPCKTREPNARFLRFCAFIAKSLQISAIGACLYCIESGAEGAGSEHAGTTKQIEHTIGHTRSPAGWKGFEPDTDGIGAVILSGSRTAPNSVTAA